MWDKDFEYYDARSAGNTVFVWQFLQKVEATDQNTVVLALSQPFSPFLRLMAQGGSGSTAIMSPASIEKYGNDEVQENPAGTGPFRFVERVRNEKIELERNDDYWGKVPYLDGVIFKPLPEAASRTAAMQAGEVDMIAVPNPDDIQSLVDSGFQLSQGVPPHVWYLSFNFNNPIMKNKLVRQAINLAIDREGMAKDLLKDSAKAAYDVQAPANAAYVEKAESYGYNPEKAKELLAQAGYPNGFETTMMTSVDGSGQLIPKPMAEYIQSDLAKVGIKLKLDTSEWISYLSKWAEGVPLDYGWAQQSWGMTTPFWLYIATSSNMIAPNGPNVGYYSNPQLDAVMDKAMTATTEEQANEYWMQANDIVTEDAALAPIINDTAPYILAPNVHGFVSASEEWYDLNGVWLS